MYEFFFHTNTPYQCVIFRVFHKKNLTTKQPNISKIFQSLQWVGWQSMSSMDRFSWMVESEVIFDTTLKKNS